MNAEPVKRPDDYPTMYLVASLEEAAALKRAADLVGTVALNAIRFKRNNVWTFARYFLESWQLVSHTEPIDEQLDVLGRSLLRRAETGENRIGIVLHGPDKLVLDTVMADAGMSADQVIADALETKEGP